MFAPILLAGLIATGINPLATPFELTAIPRVVRKEPVYEGKPKYCLLVFGKQATTRTWLVFDGRNYYVDRNGNGDLTEPGAKGVLGPNATGFSVSQIVKREGGALNTLRVQTHGDGTFDMIFGPGSNRVQFVGIEKMDRPTWGDTPENAPIIHFDGPLSFERYGPIVSIPRGEGRRRRLSLQLMLGTPGVGKGTFASYDEICSENLGPIQADIVYSHATRIGEMFEQRIELLHDG